MILNVKEYCRWTLLFAHPPRSGAPCNWNAGQNARKKKLMSACSECGTCAWSRVQWANFVSCCSYLLLGNKPHDVLLVQQRRAGSTGLACIASFDSWGMLVAFCAQKPRKQVPQYGARRGILYRTLQEMMWSQPQECFIFVPCRSGRHYEPLKDAQTPRLR